MRADKMPAGAPPAVVHASGHMTPTAPGIMEGAVEFPVRGTISLQLRRMPDDRIGPCAKLICELPYSECVMVLIRELDSPDYWWGGIAVEGYHFLVRAQREGKRMAIQFLDTKQPYYPTLEESKRAVGVAA